MSKRIRLSNERLNSYKFRVLTSGIDLEQYQRNPVLLYMHERGNVIGIVKDLKVENNELTGELFFDEASELSKRCKKQYEVGSLRMASIGFDPQEVSSAPELLVEGQERPTVTKCKLVEVSLVDIGSNDDAIAMSHDGVRVELANDGNCVLPLLNNQNNNKEMDYKKIAQQLGLPETADEATILAKIAELKNCSEELVTLKAENDKLVLASIETLVDGAIVEKRLTADKRDQFIALGKKIGSEELKSTLEAMQPQVKLSSLVSGGDNGGGNADWKKLSDVPEKDLLKLRAENPEQYKALYKAEYGIDCEI